MGVEVDVTNTGAVDGDEVIQLYVKTPTASVKAPNVRLADFGRVHIASGKTATVSLVVTPKYHSVVMNEARDDFWEPTIAVESGEFTIHVGGGQPDFTGGVLSANVDVTKTGQLTTHYRC